jgi:hypothetical protein
VTKFNWDRQSILSILTIWEQKRISSSMNKLCAIVKTQIRIVVVLIGGRNEKCRIKLLEEGQNGK